MTPYVPTLIRMGLAIFVLAYVYVEVFVSKKRPARVRLAYFLMGVSLGLIYSEILAITTNHLGLHRSD